MRVTVSLACAFLLIAQPTAHAGSLDDLSSDDRDGKRRFSLTVSAGKSHTWSENWSDKLLDAMIDANLDHLSPRECGWFGCSGPTQFPRIWNPSSQVFQITASVMLKRRIDLRIRFAYLGELGRADGMACDTTSLPFQECEHSLTIAPSLTCFEATVTYDLTRSVWVGAGLSLNQLGMNIGSRRPQENPSATESSETLFGVVLEAGIRIPARSRFHIEANWQYHIMQSSTIGPVKLTRDNGSIVRVFPETSVPFSWGYLGIGVGIRL